MSTTQGYDILVEMDRTIPSYIASSCWMAGLLPDAAIIPPGALDWSNFKGLELYFASPLVSVQTDKVVLDLPITVRYDLLPHEEEAVLNIALPHKIDTETKDGLPLQTYRIDLSGLTIDNLSFPVNEKLHEFIQGLIIDKVLQAFKDKAIEFPLTPSIVGYPLLFHSVTPPGSEPIMLFANVDGRTGGFTSSKGTLLPTAQELMVMDPKTHPRVNLAIAFSKEMLLKEAQKIMFDKGIKAGATILDNINKKVIDLNFDFDFLTGGIDIFDIDFNLFEATLERIKLTKKITLDLDSERQAIVVKGGVKAFIDNAGDQEANFEALIGLHIIDNKLSMKVKKIDIDIDDSLIDVLSVVLFGPIGLLVSNVLENYVEGLARKSIEGQTGAIEIPTQTIFLSDLAITNDPNLAEAPVTVSVRPAWVEIRDDAIIVQNTIINKSNHVSRKYPQYFTGHRQTKQFHVDGCKYGDLIKIQNRELFVRANEALEAGYDGCKNCIDRLDGKGVGKLAIIYKRPAEKGTVRTTTASFVGKFNDIVRTQNSTKEWSVQGKKIGEQYGAWTDVIALENLAPGVWNIQITDDNWSTTVNALVKGGKSVTKHVEFEQSK